MSFRASLRRFFSWDSRGTRPTGNGESARAQDTFNAQVNGRSSGSDTGYSQRFTH